MKKYKIPTGALFVDDYSKGELETLSIGDYGKSKNIKADFLGFTKEINGVPNCDIMPLSEKWVITVSTQYGCSSSCNFCDVPKVKFKGNATFDDLKKQLYSAISLFEGVKYTERLNLHFARMGDPSYNKDVLSFSEWLYKNKNQIKIDTGLRIEVIHPVFTTMCPSNNAKLTERLLHWCNIKNVLYNGQAGLQLSINSTNEFQRKEMFNNEALSLEEISCIAKTFPEPISRKYCLNFALADSYEVDAEKLKSLFNPDFFMVKITPIHCTNAGKENDIKTREGYYSYLPYKKAETDLKNVGFDVLVFVPSFDEENGLVTCGNAILGGSELRLETKK